jgi:AcrR family transcriptional regulator
MALRSVPKPKRRSSAADGRGRDDLKRAILDAARRLCLSDGIDGVSARKIAREVGCSPSAIYFYYRNVDEVLHHLRMEGHAVLSGYFAEGSTARYRRGVGCAMSEAYFRFGREPLDRGSLRDRPRCRSLPTARGDGSRRRSRDPVRPFLTAVPMWIGG